MAPRTPTDIDERRTTEGSDPTLTDAGAGLELKVRTAKAKESLPPPDKMLLGIAAVAGLAGLAVLLGLGYITLSKYRITLRDPAAFDPGLNSSIGEFIGGVVGTLFALVGVLIYFAAIRMQSRELRMMREALELQRQATILQKDALKLQARELNVISEEMAEGERTRNFTHCNNLLHEAQVLVDSASYSGALGMDSWCVMVRTMYNLLLSDLNQMERQTTARLETLKFHEENGAALGKFQLAMERLSRFVTEIRARKLRQVDRESLLQMFEDLIDNAELTTARKHLERINEESQHELAKELAAIEHRLDELANLRREMVAIGKYLDRVCGFMEEQVRNSQVPDSQGSDE